MNNGSHFLPRPKKILSTSCPALWEESHLSYNVNAVNSVALAAPRRRGKKAHFLYGTFRFAASGHCLYARIGHQPKPGTAPSPPAILPDPSQAISSSAAPHVSHVLSCLSPSSPDPVVALAREARERASWECFAHPSRCTRSQDIGGLIIAKLAIASSMKIYLRLRPGSARA